MGTHLMSTSVELSFVKNFEAEVHLQYQQMGSKLRNTVRTKNNVVGATTTFQKVGKGTASTKARHSEVKTDITWHGDRAAHFVNNMMSQGACLIDPAGVVTLRCLEN
jgi:Phage capsid protein